MSIFESNYYYNPSVVATTTSQIKIKYPNWEAKNENFCTIESSWYDDTMEQYETQLSCGDTVLEAEGNFNYCPICGAKVVS